MKLEPEDLALLVKIADLRAFLSAPRTPLLDGDLRSVMRRMNGHRVGLARLERQWLNRGLAAAGLPLVPEWTSDPLPPARPGRPAVSAPDHGPALTKTPPPQRAPRALDIPSVQH
jgi:hypothetical protein